MAGGEQASGPVERVMGAILPLAPFGGAGVKRHADPQRPPRFIPRGGEEAPLRREGGRKGGGGVREGGDKAVAGVLKDLPAVGGNRAGDDGVVAFERAAHHLRMLLPLGGAALDVRKEEG